MASRDKLHELDGLRGIAAIVVFLGHYVLNFMPTHHNVLQDGPFFGCLNGPAAVILFFVLSGFVLVRRPLSVGQPSAIVGPVLRRWPRLSRTVLVASFFYIGAAWSGALPTPSYVIGVIPTPPAILTWGWGRDAGHPAAVLWEALIGTFVAGTAKHNDVLWTMRHELLGSLVVLALAMVLMLRLHVLLRLALFVAGSLAATAVNPYLGCFVIGAAMAALHGRRAIVLSGWMASAMAIAAMLIFSWDVRKPVGIWAWAGSYSSSLWIAAQTVASVALIAVVLYNPTAKWSAPLAVDSFRQLF